MAELTKDARGFVSGIVQYLSRDKNITVEVPKIRKLLSKVTASNEKDVEAIVVSAVALREEEKTSLKKALQKLVGHPVQLSCAVDPTVIAGIRITIGDWIVDTTFKNQLQTIAHVLGENTV